MWQKIDAGVMSVLIFKTVKGLVSNTCVSTT